MKIIRNSILPLKGFKTVNILGVLFVREGTEVDAVTLRHEEIHTRQMKEMLFVGFYLWYAVEWLFCLMVFLNFHDAYRMNCFEQEAYQNEDDERYLEKRKHYAWMRYL